MEERALTVSGVSKKIDALTEIIQSIGLAIIKEVICVRSIYKFEPSSKISR